MKIGEVIRRYRKEKGMTQEEMANCLGVTAPAVNKWENGNSLPDITLLSPIARLLGVSLEELLSFREELSAEEIRELVQRAEQKFSREPFEDVFRWVKEQIQQYPNCEPLIQILAAELDGHRLMQELPENQEYDAFILGCYERLTKSSDEAIRTSAADLLYAYYLRSGQYEKAETCLSFFSAQNPERKRKQAELYERTGDQQKASQTYEEILLAEQQVLSAVFNSLFIMQLKDGDLEKAAYYAEKKKALARLFEMGEYAVYSADLELVLAEKNPDKTIACMQGILEHIDSIYAFSQAPLYSHMTFKKPDPAFLDMLRKDILEGLFSDESFQYMKGDPRWEELTGKV